MPRRFRLWWSLPVILGVFPVLHGATYQVNNIAISGNQAVSDRDLKAVLRLKEPQFFKRTEFDQRILKLDAIVLKNYYISRGFLNVSVRDSFQLVDDSRVNIFFKVQEGPQTRLQAVEVHGNQALPEKRILQVLGLKPGSPYNPIGLKSSLPVLETEYLRQGKLYTRVDVYESRPETLRVRLEIREGPDVYIRRIVFQGLEGLDTRYVERELLFQSGDLFQQDRIDETRKRISETGLFSYVKISPAKTVQPDSVVDVIVELRQLKPREWISEGGFYPFKISETAEELSSLGGLIEWRNRNMLGSTRRLGLRTEVNVPITENLRNLNYMRYRSEIRLNSQWLWRWRIPTQLSGYYETYPEFPELTFRIQKYGVQLSNIYRLDLRSYVRTGLHWQRFIQPEADRQKNIEQRTLNLSLHLDKSDHPIYPAAGKKLIADLASTGGVLGGNRDFIKLDLGWIGYATLFRSVVLAGRLKAGRIFGWKAEYVDVSNNEKFYLGGSNSLRGWETLRFRQLDGEPYGETHRILTNLELRIPLFWLLGTEWFIDGGYLDKSFRKFSLTGMQWNVGAGLTLESPLGPVRIDYAIRLDHVDGKVSLSENRIFFLGVLYAF